jgi:hypothetical protein
MSLVLLISTIFRFFLLPEDCSPIPIFKGRLLLFTFPVQSPVNAFTLISQAFSDSTFPRRILSPDVLFIFLAPDIGGQTINTFRYIHLLSKEKVTLL